MTQRVLTGITTTGTPHLGNYVGAIRPAIASSLSSDVTSFYFLADYHSLIKCGDPERIQRSTLEIAATWLAAGLDPTRVHFYRQSDVPETTELTWLLTCVTGKGLLNRAHAYKAAVDANHAAGLDADAAITAGLYSYPVLMAADILIFNAHKVPVGRDQVQHIEIARDVAQRFNHLYGKEFFTLPDAVVDEDAAVLPGLDGRKMSKSYDNTIPLWLGSRALKDAIGRVVTNSKGVSEAKFPDESSLFPIYQAFVSPLQYQAFLRQCEAGLGWGDIKAVVHQQIDSTLAPMRERYEALIAKPAELEATLKAGAERARALCTPFVRELKHAVGLRSLAAMSTGPRDVAQKKLAKLSTFRDSEGFRFKLTAADGKTVLLESVAFDDARACGMAMAKVKTGAVTLRDFDAGCEALLDDAVIANGPSVADVVQAALTELVEAN